MVEAKKGIRVMNQEQVETEVKVEMNLKKVFQPKSILKEKVLNQALKIIEITLFLLNSF